MSAQKTNVSESEYEILKILWDSETPLSVSGVLHALPENKWKSNTVATLLTRLVDKGAISYDKKGKVHLYYPILKREEYNLKETKSLLSKMYHGSVRNMVATLYENKAITSEEMADLRNLFELE